MGHPSRISEQSKNLGELHHNYKQLLLDKDHQSISGNVSVQCESLCGNNKAADWFLFFFEDAVHLWVWKHYRPQLSKRKSPGGRRETTCYERRLGNPKAAAWTCLEQYPSSARLDTKHIIPSCQRFSPLLKNKCCKKTEETINRPTTQVVQAIPHKSSLAIMTIQFYIQISMSNKILMPIQ